MLNHTATMTKVIHLPRPHVGHRVQLSARTPKPTTCAADCIQRQQAIENALSMALFFIRQPDSSDANVWAATARTNRALTLLKQASKNNPGVRSVAARVVELATGRA